MSISADGKTIAVAGAEGTITLHDSATGKCPRNRPTAATYFSAGDVAGRVQTLPIDAKTVLGLGKVEKNLLLLRQETPEKISVERVQ